MGKAKDICNRCVSKPRHRGFFTSIPGPRTAVLRFFTPLTGSRIERVYEAFKKFKQENKAYGWKRKLYETIEAIKKN
jgi:hypothetical protein